jgi:hypothetical protein
MKEKYQNERFKNIWGTCVSYLEWGETRPPPQTQAYQILSKLGNDVKM